MQPEICHGSGADMVTDGMHAKSQFVRHDSNTVRRFTESPQLSAGKQPNTDAFNEINPKKYHTQCA